MKTSKKKTTIKITWSIHECRKQTTKGDNLDTVTGYMTVRTIGRKKERVMHTTLGAALNHVGI